jgi:putative oxidoreductase
MAFLAGAAETGGVLLALGLLTPLAALGLVATMTTAIATVHWAKGFWNTKGGYEFNLALIAAVVAITMTGPGRFSLDRAIGWDDDITGLWWGVGVLVAGVAGAFATSAIFHSPPPQQQPAQ